MIILQLQKKIIHVYSTWNGKFSFENLIVIKKNWNVIKIGTTKFIMLNFTNTTRRSTSYSFQFSWLPFLFRGTNLVDFLFSSVMIYWSLIPPLIIILFNLYIFCFELPPSPQLYYFVPGEWSHDGNIVISFACLPFMKW